MLSIISLTWEVRNYKIYSCEYLLIRIYFMLSVISITWEVRNYTTLINISPRDIGRNICIL